MRPMAMTVPTAVCDMAPKSSRRRDRRHRERAAHAADDRHDHGDDAPRDAALRHDLAGQHEERHGEQRKIVEAAEHVGLDGSVGTSATVRTATIDVTRRMRKIGKSDQQQHYRQREIDEIGHHRRLVQPCASLGGLAARAPRVRSRMATSRAISV